MHTNTLFKNSSSTTVESKTTDGKKQECTKENIADNRIASFCQEAEKYYYNAEYVNSMESLVKILKIDAYNANAQYLLGLIYEFHVEDSLQDSVRWYTAAHANGHKKAGRAIDRVIEQLNNNSAKIINPKTVSFGKKNN